MPNSKKRILVLGADGYDNVSVNVERALRELGHDAERFFVAPKGDTWPLLLYKFFVRSPWYSASLRLQNAARELMGRPYLQKIREYKPDLVFIVHFGHMTPDQIRTVTQDWGIPVAWWVMADAALVSRFDPFHVDLYSYATHLFIADTSWISTFKLLGNAKMSYLPFAADPFLYHPVGRKKIHDVGIVAAFGAEVPTVIHKGFILSRLARERIPVTAVAQGMKKYFALMPDLRMVRAIDEVYLAPQVNDFYNETNITLTLNNPQAKSDPHVRVFECAATRNFQIAEYRENTTHLLEDSVVQFRTLDELVALTKFYLQHEREREKLAARSYELVLERHTTKHRMQQVIAEVFGHSAAREIPRKNLPLSEVRAREQGGRNI